MAKLEAEVRKHLGLTLPAAQAAAPPRRVRPRLAGLTTMAERCPGDGEQGSGGEALDL